MAKNIEDFGQKIGGAKKDLWKSRGLDITDITEFNEAERDKFIQKDNVWIKPDYDKMFREEGYSREAVYFINTVRNAIPKKPQLNSVDSNKNLTEEEKHDLVNLCQEVYIDFVQKLRDEVLEVKTTADIDKFGLNFFDKHDYAHKGDRYWSFTERGNICISKKLFEDIQMTSKVAIYEVSKKEYLYNAEEKVRKNLGIRNTELPNYSYDDSYTNDYNKICIKAEFYGNTNYYYVKNDSPITKDILKENPYIVTENNTIIHAAKTKEEATSFLDNLVAEKLGKKVEQSPEVDEGKSNRKKSLLPPQLQHIQRIGQPVRNKEIVGQDLIDAFGIKGGEFGNWLNEKDRQANLNFAYDSLKDIAKAFNIQDKDVAINGRLNIAFGARGSGKALAHYEPLREVINLTKMKGAGSLAHEYFHALDNIVGKMHGSNGFITEISGKISMFDKTEKNEKKYEEKMKCRETTDKELLAVFDDLVNTMKTKEIVVSVEEQLNNNKKYLETAIDKFRKEVDMMVPDRILDEGLIAKKNELVNALIEKAKEPEFHGIELASSPRSRNLKQTANPAMKELFDFIGANSKSYKMISQNQLYLASKLDSVVSANYHLLNDDLKPMTKKIETNFYKDAQAINDAYTMSGHDNYWSSNIEMAARAFACYVKDKLAEQGIRNDYLCGHAEFPSVPIGEGKVAYTYPRGEERAAINKAFDKVIAELKTRGIINEKKQSLDDIIKAASGKTVDNPTNTSPTRDKTI